MARFGKTPESETLVNQAGIVSHGTRNSYEQALRGFVEHARESGYQGSLKQAPASLVEEYLGSRSELVSQSTLDRDRQAITAITGEAYDRIKSEQPDGRLSEASRSYTDDQIQLIQEQQPSHHALATQVAAETGARAHELYTLRPTTERGPTQGRDWSGDRFSGRSDQVSYTVQGKGGLVREVSMSRETAGRLEQCRLSEPQRITDRGIVYVVAYSIGGGQSWSQSFSEASERMFEFSHGAHGLRHSYAQDRMNELKQAGYYREDALRVVSQEMGHFRPEITETYLR